MNRRLISWVGFLAFGTGGFSGCQSSLQTAFPTAETVARSGAAPGTDLATLALGRKIFTTSCTECHVARPIAAYSVAQWRENVSVMAPRAHLTADDRAALEAYLSAARASWPRG